MYGKTRLDYFHPFYYILSSMKVLLIAENWPPRVGGIENYLTGIVAHLPASSTTVIAPELFSSPAAPREARHSGDKGRLGGVVKNSTPPSPLIKGVITIRKRFFWPWLKPAWLPLYLSIKKLVGKNRPDVVFCGKALFEGLVGLWLKQKFGIPYVIFTYAMEIEVWAKTERAKLEKVLKHADRVVYVNEVTKKSLVDLGVTEKQLVKIWPGTNDDWLKPVLNGQEVLSKYGITGPYVFTLTRLIKRKGVDVALEAFASIYRYIDAPGYMDVCFVVAGSGPELENLQTRARELGLDGRVKFLGHVPDEDLPALYSNAKVFALTPRRDAEDIEGFGIVYLEAAACGVPAIGTLVGGIPEAVIDNQTGILVQPDNPKAIAEALTLLLKDENKRKALGEAAKKRAYDEFRWSKRILLVKGMIDAILTRS